MKNYSVRGFTLIELLVVIAIIGVLSSIVLASLNTARSKGADASIKSNLSNVRAQAEIQNDSTGCYSSYASAGSCSGTAPAVLAAAECSTHYATAGSIFNQSNIRAAIAAATSSAGTAFSSCAATVGGTAWAIVVPLKSTNTLAWCVDSTGASKQVSLSAATQAGSNAAVTGGVCN